MLVPAPSLLTTERRRIDALGDIIAPWRELADGAAEPNVFYDPAFAVPAAAAFGRNVEAILVWRGGAQGELVGLFPFEVAARRYLAKFPIMIGWTHRFAPLGTPLVASGTCDEAVAAFLDHVAGDDALPKLILLPLIDEDGPVAAALSAALGQHGAMRAFGCHRRAALKPAGARDGYLEHAIGAKRRKEWRRQRRRLAEQGPVSFTLAATAAAVAPALAEFLALEAAGWKGRAGTAIAQHPDIRRFVETAIGALAARGQVQAARLACGSRSVACVLTMRSGGVAWSWKVAYDESVAGASPGVQAFLDLTEGLLADASIAAVDSCAVQNHPMIDHLWRERITLADWLIAGHPGAAFTLACRLEGARRKAYVLVQKLRDRMRGRPRRLVATPTERLPETTRHVCKLPPPLAGEGWGEGLFAPWIGPLPDASRPTFPASRRGQEAP